MADQPYNQSNLSIPRAIRPLGQEAERQARTYLTKGHSALRNLRFAEALVSGSAYRVKNALEAGADPDMRISRGHPTSSVKAPQALVYSLQRRRWPVAGALLEGGANPDCIDPQTGRSALEIATLAWEREAIDLAVNLMEAGADLNAPLKGAHGHESYLHLLAKHNLQLRLVKPALLGGADTHVTDDKGLTAEEYLEPNASLSPSPSKQGVMYWTMRQHRLAPTLPEAGELNRKALEQTNDNGSCALDHWQCWDAYHEVQTALKDAGEPLLKASDLVQPLGGNGKNAPTRLEMMLHLCPEFQQQLADPQLWEGESVQVLRAMKRILPDEMQNALPYHRLAAQLTQEQQSAVRVGR